MLVYSAIGIGSGVLIAQAFGPKNREEVSATAGLALTIAGVFGVCTRVGKDILEVAFWGILIAACVQPAKIPEIWREAIDISKIT
jgi:hypothetical protein